MDFVDGFLRRLQTRAKLAAAPVRGPLVPGGNLTDTRASFPTPGGTAAEKTTNVANAFRSNAEFAATSDFTQPGMTNSTLSAPPAQIPLPTQTS